MVRTDGAVKEEGRAHTAARVWVRGTTVGTDVKAMVDDGRRCGDGEGGEMRMEMVCV